MPALEAAAAAAPVDERISWRASGDIGGGVQRGALELCRMVGYASCKPADALVFLLPTRCNFDIILFSVSLTFYYCIISLYIKHYAKCADFIIKTPSD